MGLVKKILRILLALCICVQVSIQLELNVHDLKIRRVLEAVSSKSDTSTQLKQLIIRAIANKGKLNEPDPHLKVTASDMTEELKKTILAEIEQLEDKGKSFFGAFEEGLEKLACNMGITRFCETSNNNSTAAVDDNEPSIDLPSTSIQKPDKETSSTSSGTSNTTTVASTSDASEDDFDDGGPVPIPLSSTPIPTTSATTTTGKTIDDAPTFQEPQPVTTTTEENSNVNNETSVEAEPIDLVSEQSLPPVEDIPIPAPSVPEHEEVPSTTVAQEEPESTTEKVALPVSVEVSNNIENLEEKVKVALPLLPSEASNQVQTTSTSAPVEPEVTTQKDSGDEKGSGSLADSPTIEEIPGINALPIKDNKSSEEKSTENNSGESNETISPEPVASSPTTTTEKSSDENLGETESLEESDDDQDSGSEPSASTPEPASKESEESVESTTDSNEDSKTGRKSS